MYTGKVVEARDVLTKALDGAAQIKDRPLQRHIEYILQEENRVIVRTKRTHAHEARVDSYSCARVRAENSVNDGIPRERELF